MISFPFTLGLRRASPSLLVKERVRRRSVELQHVEVVEWHEVPIAAEDIHVTLGVLDRTVTVASGWLPALDETKFTLMCLLRALVESGVREPALSLSLLHALVVRVKALVGILDNERAGHRD